MNIWAIVVAVIVVFVASAIYYVIFAKQRAKLTRGASEGPSPRQVLLEFARNIVLALVLACLVQMIDIKDAGGAVMLALLLWVGFPVILLSGSVMYEKAPAKLALIHGGDWLIKLLLMTVIIGSWR